MSEYNAEIFNKLQEMDDSQLMQIFEKSDDEVCKMMTDIIKTVGKEGRAVSLLYGYLKKAENFILNMYRSYLIFCKKSDMQPVLSIAMKNFKASTLDDSTVLSASYFGDLAGMDEEVRNAYMLTSDKIMLYHIKASMKLFSEIKGKGLELKKELQEALKYVACPDGKNLFIFFMELLKSSGNDSKNMDIIMQQTLRIINFAEDIRRELLKTGISVECEADKCREVYESYISFINSTKTVDDKVKEATSPAARYGFTESTDILSKLLEFSNTDKEFKQNFTSSLAAFNKLPDKKGSDDNSRAVRKKLTANFYELYEKVFLRAARENVDGLVLNLFLNYGVVDEKMFSEDTIKELESLVHSGEVKNAHVYTAKQWLDAIYSGQKQPSRNDLDMDYQAHVTDMERRGDISPEQKQQYLNNRDLKVDYEIKNFIRMNSRLTNGELSVFCPVLTEEEFITSPAQMFIKDDMVTEAIDWLLTADYSVFHREQMYDSRENGISNMLINVQVFPDIILMPVSGVHSRMWQEIDGKKRDTPGRFTLPAFTKQDLKDLIIQAAGSFRWQLCKKIQGNYWNIVSEKSLTSEYYDYIQFYKKNRDLSDQAKEKIGSQLQRARNNFAECFAMDYVIWVKNEVSGSVRLNKIVREIMATYCAPSKEYRENLKNQPMFVAAFARYEREKAKKIKEINNRRAAIRNANGEETPEFVAEAKFWEET